MAKTQQKQQAPKTGSAPEYDHVAPMGETTLRVDPHRYEPRVRMLIDSVPLRLQIASALVPQGKHTVDVPESREQEILDMVETDLEALRMAQRRFQQIEREWEKEHKNKLVPDSVEKQFRAITGRDPKPLRSAKVLERGVPAPLTQEERRTAAVVQAFTGDQPRVIKSVPAGGAPGAGESFGERPVGG